ncbi:hypothetical protein ACFW6F_28915 [Streptomyces sp. NPDC058746]|uniref:hypothetical protein n=1 Tax=Streptomyces sp. NPDC058746 TaxID=3346622 RepID=UPI00368C705D
MSGMNGAEQVLKESIDEVVGGYRTTGDPFVRVETAVRHRRRRNRAVVGASLAAAVAASVATVAALPGGPGQESARPAAAATASVDSPSVVLPGYEMVPGTVYRVARGTHAGVEWQVGSADGLKGQACLVSRNVLIGIAACFPTGDAVVHWAAASSSSNGRTADEPFTVVGVAPKGAARVRVVLSGGSGPQAETVATPTAADTRFFAVLVPGSIRQQVQVQALDATGSPLGAPVAADGKQQFKDRTPPWCRTGGDHPADGPETTAGPGTDPNLIAGAPCGTPSSALGRPVAPSSAPPSSSPPR